LTIADKHWTGTTRIHKQIAPCARDTNDIIEAYPSNMELDFTTAKDSGDKK